MAGWWETILGVKTPESVYAGYVDANDRPETAPPFDPDLPWELQQEGWNRGCPPGYYTQFVAPGTEGAVDYGSPIAWARCRSLPDAPAGTPAYQQQVAKRITETAPPMWSDAALNFDRAARDAARAAGEAAKDLAPAIGLGLLPVALIGLAALWMMTRR